MHPYIFHITYITNLNFNTKMDRVDLTNEENMRSGEDRLALGSLNDKELHFAVEMAHLLSAIAVGTGTWGIAAVIPKYLSLRLPLRVVNLIEEAFQIAMTGGDPLKFEYGNEGCNMVSLDLSRLKQEILKGKLAGKAHKKVESGCSKVTGCTTKERSFTLPKILEYTKDHCNLNTAPTIISMLNYFLRNAEDSTQEEKNMVDEVERMMLHPDRGDQVTGNKSSFTENAQQVNFTFPSGISAKELMANFPKILKQLKKSRNG
jgi:hypothetical protein